MINASVGQGLDSGMKKRMGLDRRLLAALLDRWRPETHTFHLPCGEMAPTLQDVSYLLGLPIAREAVGAVDILDTWRLELSTRFADVMVPPNHEAFHIVPDQIGPTKSWILQYKVCILYLCCNIIMFY
jgi:hypothetical protein